MAAGKITKNVTYATGSTVPLQFYADDTVTPTVVNQINMIEGTAGNLLVIDTNGSAQTTLLDAAGAAITFEPSVAHDAADSGNSVKIGAKATTSLAGLTLVANADRTNLFAGIDGVQIVRPHCNLEDILDPVPVAITDGSSTSVIAALGVGIRAWVTDAIIANSSATAVTVDLRDGAAGTVRATLPVPANSSGVVKTFGLPIRFTANTAVCADPSAAASTVTVTLLAFKSKV